MKFGWSLILRFPEWVKCERALETTIVVWPPKGGECSPHFTHCTIVHTNVTQCTIAHRSVTYCTIAPHFTQCTIEHTDVTQCTLTCWACHATCYITAAHDMLNCDTVHLSGQYQPRGVQECLLCYQYHILHYDVMYQNNHTRIFHGNLWYFFSGKWW